MKLFNRNNKTEKTATEWKVMFIDWCGESYEEIARFKTEETAREYAMYKMETEDLDKGQEYTWCKM